MGKRRGYNYDSVRRALEFHANAGAITLLCWGAEERRPFGVTFKGHGDNLQLTLPEAHAAVMGLTQGKRTYGSE